MDQAIGERLRFRRTELGLTQEQLATVLGLSYQQLQRFEHGTSRIAAVQLLVLARRLGVPITYFFTDPPQAEAPDRPAIEHGARQRTALELARCFAAIDNDAVRVAIASLTRAIAERAT